ETEITSLVGRASLVPQAINGRGQVVLDEPAAIQIYLPVAGENNAALLEHLEKEVSSLEQAWNAVRPEEIPMAPSELTYETFNGFVPKKERDAFYLGLNKLSSIPESFHLFQGKTLGIFTESNRQFQLLTPWFIQQVTGFQ